MEDIPLDRLRRAVSAVAGELPRVAAVYVYGSRAAGNALPLSDLDLAVVLRRGGPRDDPLLAERMAARVAIELGASVEIDAHLAEDLPLPVRGRVVVEGVLLYETDARRRVEFETGTRRLYFDFLPLLERDAREALRRG